MIIWALPVEDRKVPQLATYASAQISTESFVAAFADMDKNTLVAQAFSNCFGSFGGMFVAVAVLFFAFSTILGWSYYGTRSWIYLFGEKTAIIYKIVFVGIIFVSSILTNVDLPWNISDTFNGLMMVPNLIGVLALAPLVVKITNNYARRSFKNSGETPMYSAFEEIQSAQEAAEKESI